MEEQYKRYVEIQAVKFPPFRFCVAVTRGGLTIEHRNAELCHIYPLAVEQGRLVLKACSF